MNRIKASVIAIAIATAVLIPSTASASVAYSGWYYGYCLGSMAYYGSWCNGMS